MKRVSAAVIIAMVIAASHGHSGTEGPTPAIPAVDREVLECALADLLSYKGDDSPLKLMIQPEVSPLRPTRRSGP
jgi:hypothetical protein